MTHRQGSGFTLIEVMIAIVIMAVLSLIAWRGLDTLSRTTAHLQERTEQTAQWMRTLQQIERDLAWRTTVELDTTELTAARATRPTLRGATAAAAPQPSAALLPVGMAVRRQPESLFMIEVVRAAPAAPGHWQRVQWWIRSGTLYRAAGAPAAVYPLPAPLPADQVAVLDQVASFEVRAWEPGTGWQRLPSLGRAGAVASGLEITLGQRRGDGPVLLYRQVIALR
ncbi:prepilin-type N-terminal cleavage/methylation domain-containing protein [Roseateles amylovorans]|uniref:Prepilin-type N-terminal cleavage/methylation domain-containing protein n=1 Tax=Roseateles amylovorans TaxID=2978473 RepID=A0ABY6NMR4_9BURK|nr:prepilin-type N-terminal cleavage/methylation domain-containing protein [Roseateles amylovorans]UZH44148.1 prepilin-type N-terminal cleavage/methylation domain-containing protein [Roseateles amylovorans]